MNERTQKFGLDAQRSVRWLQYVVPLLVIAAALTSWAAYQESSEGNRTDDIAACRSLYGADITEAQLRFDTTQLKLDAIGVESDQLLREIIVALVNDDDQFLLDTIRSFQDLNNQVNDTVSDSEEALDIINNAVDNFVVAVDKSRTNPTKFLNDCQQENGHED